MTAKERRAIEAAAFKALASGYLNARSVAAFMDCSEREARGIMSILPRFKHGKFVRIRKSDLERWAETFVENRENILDGLDQITQTRGRKSR